MLYTFFDLFLYFTINLSKSILTISIGKIKYVSIYFIFVMVFFLFSSGSCCYNFYFIML